MGNSGQKQDKKEQDKKEHDKQANGMQAERLNEELMKIKPINRDFYQKCKARWNSIAKPLNGLGRLEEMICQIGAIREDIDAPVEKKCAVVMCADNGVVCEGISQTDESVTAIVAKNLADGIANVNLMGRISNTTVFPVNIGMKEEISHPKVINRCVRRGTDNIADGPAMSRDECIQAILYGIEMSGYAKRQGFDMIASGEMGIGNTTTSSAIASVLLGVEPKLVTGKGAGLSDEGLEQKIRVIQRAIEKNSPNVKDPVDILSKIGGLDIAGMTGLFAGGAVYGIPVVIDGLISTVSAILATMLNEDIIDYVIPSHAGKEPACEMLSKRLGKKPYIFADMALGEGTGAVSLFPLIDMAHEVYSQNITFGDINMEAYKPL